MTSVNLTALPEVSFRATGNNKPIKRDFSAKLTEVIKKICQVAWNILLVIIFPIGLVRLAIRKFAPMLVLPASHMFDLDGKRKELNGLSQNQVTARKNLENEIAAIEQIHEKRNEFLENESNHAEQITVDTADGVEIDTVKIINQNSDKWIIYFCPNGACYEQLLENLKEISEKSGANVYTGNYRGVMRSKGKIESTHDMVLDGEAMIQKLLSEGVPEENILVHGWSVGGGVATEVASNHPKVHHCSDRSFASLIHFLKGWVPVVGGVIGGIAWLAHWRFNSAKNFEKIQGKKLVIYSKADWVIPFEGSLFKVLKNKNIQFDSIHLAVSGDEAEYIRLWKENNPNVDDATAEKQARKEFNKELGKASHSFSLNASQEIFDGYISFVKDALNLA